MDADVMDGAHKMRKAGLKMDSPDALARVCNNAGVFRWVMDSNLEGHAV
jgi:hypothetical protein